MKMNDGSMNGRHPHRQTAWLEKVAAPGHNTSHKTIQTEAGRFEDS
ncbi:MAG: hypothetical protein AB1586_16560 [Pseudomonadota bacterium]|jgi:hypothetical protein